MKQTKTFIKQTESQIQKAVKEYLAWNGWFVFKIHQSLGSYKGIADLFAIRDGLGIWIEIKTPAGRQSEYQKLFQRKIEKHGGTYLLVRSVDELKKDLKNLEQRDNKILARKM